MPKAYSEDLRGRVVKAYRLGKSAASLSEQYEISIPCIYRWDKIERETGSLQPLYKAGDRSIIRDDAKFLQFLEVHAHSTLSQMAASWETQISEMSLSRKLKKLEITRKKRLAITGNGTK
jgi:transposase